MTKRWLSFLLLASTSNLVAGCEKIAALRNPAIAGCQSFIMDLLKSPSSFNVVSVRSTTEPSSLVEWNRLHEKIREVTGRALRAMNPSMMHVIIDYDAANSFGASLRSQQICDFPVSDKDGTPSTEAVKAAIDLTDVAAGAWDHSDLKCCSEAFAKAS